MPFKVKDDERLYLVTDRSLCKTDLIDSVIHALDGGVRIIQLREKDLSPRALLHYARTLREITLDYGAKLIINDRADIARIVGADGVHLGQKSYLPQDARAAAGEGGKLIGVSTHTLEEAFKAAHDGADYVTFGPVYSTPSKELYGAPIGTGYLKMAAEALDIPVYAIGGIKKENVGDAIATGAAGVAVISAVLASPDIAKGAKELIEEIRTSRN